MNEQRKTTKIIFAVLFLAFAGISCWATVESLYLSLPDIPKIVFWVAVIGIFILTSYITKILVDSFNPNVYMEKRGTKLIGCILGIVLLWLCFSMPTNTHTFFYKKMVKDIAKNELNFLNVELNKLTDENLYIQNYNNEWESYKTKVNNKLESFYAEIENYQMPGHGQRAEEKLQQVETELGLKKGEGLQRLQKIGVGSQKERTEIKKFYGNQVYGVLENQKKEHENRLQSQLKGFRNEANKVKDIKKNISATLNELDNPALEQTEVINKATMLAQTGHAVLNAKYGYLSAGDSYKKQSVYSLDRLKSITKVWGDYLKGEFKDKNYGLIYWILLSIIVDLAAFLFFNIAFKSEE